MCSVNGQRYVRGMSPVKLRLRELRNTKGLTQDELAAAIGVSQRTISRLESGWKPRADLGQLVAICQVLGVTMSDLVPVPAKRRK